jgi:CRP/FNR family transcriptional regulator, cyclic AMP receptor protein
MTFNTKTFLSTDDRGRKISTYQVKQNIYSQGDPANAVFYVREGKIKVCVVSDLGKEAIVALHGKGDFFGEGCLIAQPLRLATTVAMTECAIMRIDKRAAVRALRNEHKFAEMFMAHLLTRNARVEEDLVDQLFNSSEQRLARLLLLMAKFGREGETTESVTLVERISQETLANMIGTTRSRVSSFMSKFRKSGYIKYDSGQLEVHNSLLNVILRDKPHLRRGIDSK